MMKTDGVQYFYTIPSGRGGPVGFAELRSLATAGKITRHNKVWTEGMAEWVSAEAVQDLFQDLPPDLQAEPVPGPAVVMRKQATRFWHFLTSVAPGAVVPKKASPTRLRWLSQLSGRAGILLLIMVCLIGGFAWKSVREVSAREQRERERPQREAEIRDRQLRYAGDDGFRAGAKLAAQSATTGGYRLARTETEIQFLAQEVLNGKVPGIGAVFRASSHAPSDQWAAWKDGFVEGYIDYMARLKKRFAPAY